jgi:hypothetical protein
VAGMRCKMLRDCQQLALFGMDLRRRRYLCWPLPEELEGICQLGSGRSPSHRDRLCWHLFQTGCLRNRGQVLALSALFGIQALGG